MKLFSGSLLMVMVFFLLGAGVAQTAQGAFEDDLELYLELNDATGFTAADSSGNGRNGAVVNRGGAIDNLQLGDPLPADPLNTNDQYWVSGRFGGGFAPAGAPDADGDPNPLFCGSTATCTDPFDSQHYAGSGFAMVGVNLTNGATTGGIPDNITSTAFTYSFHVQMPYNSTYSKNIGNRMAGDDTVKHNEVLLDGLRMTNNGLALASSDTNFWDPSGVASLNHVQDNRWAWTQVGENSFSDNLFHHHRAGAVPLESSTTPALFDVSGPGTLVDGNWHHVAIVQDYSIGTASTDGNIKDVFLYIDGNLVSWTNENLGSTAADAILGGITLGASSNHRGGDGARLYFDDFALWSRPLSASEIGELSSRSLDSILNNADFNGDNSVDGADFLIWQRGFGLTGQTSNTNGDANGDGVVDSLDLQKWQNQYGLEFAPLSATSTAVPEPSSLVITFFGLMTISCARRPG